MSAMYVCSHIELSLRLSFMLGVFLFGLMFD